MPLPSLSQRMSGNGLICHIIQYKFLVSILLFTCQPLVIPQACIIVCDVTRRHTLSNVHIWKNDVDTKCGDIPILLLANKVNYRLFDFDSLYSLTSVKADLSHNISEEELLKFGRALNFTDTAFTTAKDFSKLENQIRTFAELVKSLQSLTFGLTL